MFLGKPGKRPDNKSMVAQSGALADKFLPAYPVAEAARIIGANPETLRTWLRGRSYKVAGQKRRALPVFDSAHSEGGPLSFIDLVEAHVVHAMRRGYGIPMRNLRKAITYLREKGGDLLFLAHADFLYDRMHLYLNDDQMLLSLSERGQYVNRDVISKGLKQLDYGSDGYASRFYPSYIGLRERSIVVDPTISFGRPSVARLGVSADAIFDRFDAGESIPQLAEDYNAQAEEIENALRWVGRKAA